MQTLSELEVWLQSYEQFISTKSNIKQKNLNSFFANISETIFATSDSFPLIMSHIAGPTHKPSNVPYLFHNHCLYSIPYTDMHDQCSCPEHQFDIHHHSDKGNCCRGSRLKK